MDIKLTGDYKKFNDKLHKLVNFNFTGLHREIGEHIVESTKDRFKDEKGPDGKKWEPSHRAKTTGGKTLTDNATLKNSITYKATSSKVDAGTNMIYAGVHQRGKTIKAKSKYLKFKIGKRWAQKKKVKIPARPSLGISPDDRKEIKGITRDRIDQTSS